MTPIKFGTDGWRAVMADAFTFANVERVTQATATYWRRENPARKQPVAVIGYDRRFLSDAFARCAAEVLAGNGLRVVVTPVPTPTPAVSQAVRDHGAVGGIMFTASHNPAIFNGFKLKADFGGPANSGLCQSVEACLDLEPVRRTAFEEARANHLIRVLDLRRAHYRAIKGLVDFAAIARSRLKVAHDALFGVGAGCFEDLLAGTTCRVTTLNGAHDPNFGGINPEPVAANYGPSSAWLRRHPQDICLVTDGDADRIGGMDGRGRAVSTHQVICLLVQHLVRHRGAHGRVVKALTTTSMLDKMCAEYGLPLTETGVGFKYICTEMLKGDVMFGGEESGGIGFPGHVPERDGLLAGLFLLETLAVERVPIGRLLANLERHYGPHRYARADIRFPLALRPALMEYCAAHPPARLRRSPLAKVETFDGVKYTAQDGSWLMLRGSGTEPIVRIYAETDSDDGARALLRQGLRISRQVMP
jgi:phosphomannomutase